MRESRRTAERRGKRRGGRKTVDELIEKGYISTDTCNYQRLTDA